MAGAFGIVSFAESEVVDVIRIDTVATTVWVEDEAESATCPAPKGSLGLIETIGGDIHR